MRGGVAELPDEGSTQPRCGPKLTARLAADILPTDRELVVVTNALPIAMSLSVRPNITVLLVGGKVRGRTQAAVDAWALQALADSYVDVAFIGTNGISPERGLTTPDTTESAVKRAMIRAAREGLFLAITQANETVKIISRGSPRSTRSTRFHRLGSRAWMPQVAQSLSVGSFRVVLA